jgi:hypothetical protein
MRELGFEVTEPGADGFGNRAWQEAMKIPINTGS